MHMVKQIWNCPFQVTPNFMRWVCTAIAKGKQPVFTGIPNNNHLHRLCCNCTHAVSFLILNRRSTTDRSWQALKAKPPVPGTGILVRFMEATSSGSMSQIQTTPAWELQHPLNFIAENWASTKAPRMLTSQKILVQSSTCRRLT